MARTRGSRSDGRNSLDAGVVAVRAKGAQIRGYDPNVWRRDFGNKPIKRQEFGNKNSEHGWDVDLLRPASAVGSDLLSHLPPLQWQRNRCKGDT